MRRQGNKGRQERVRNPVKKMFAPLLSFPSKGEPAKNHYTESGRLIVSCGVTWSWSEGVNLYRRLTDTDSTEKNKTHTT